MYKTIVTILLAIFISIVQIVFLPYFSFKGIWPNLILIISLYFALSYDLKTAIIFSFVGGIIFDLLSPLKFGINAILMTVITTSVFFLVHRFFSDVNLIVAGLVSAFSLVIYSTATMIFSGNYLFNLIYIELLFGFLFGIIFYLGLNRLVKTPHVVKVEGKWVFLINLAKIF